MGGGEDDSDWGDGGLIAFEQDGNFVASMNCSEMNMCRFTEMDALKLAYLRMKRMIVSAYCETYFVWLFYLLVSIIYTQWFFSETLIIQLTMFPSGCI